jgi:hypothetical protein
VAGEFLLMEEVGVFFHAPERAHTRKRQEVALLEAGAEHAATERVKDHVRFISRVHRGIQRETGIS